MEWYIQQTKQIKMEFNAQMITEIEEALSNDKNQNFIKLPIDELDGIKVIVKIYKRKIYSHTKPDDKLYYLGVFLDGIYDDYDIHLNCPGYNLFSSDEFADLKSVLQYTMIFLKNFIVDEYNGMFKTKKYKTYTSELSKLFRPFDRVKLSDEECCICKDVMTKTKTPCGHHVCIRCVTKLPMAQDADDYDPNGDNEEMFCERKCPMCRQGFYHLS